LASKTPVAASQRPYKCHFPLKICRVVNIRPGFDLLLAEQTAPADLRDSIEYTGQALVLSTIVSGQTLFFGGAPEPARGHLLSPVAGPAETVSWLSDLSGEILLGSGQALASVTLVLSLDCFGQLGGLTGLKEELLANVDAPRNFHLHAQRPLGVQKRQIAIQMLNPPLPETCRRLFWEGKAMELLAIYLSQLADIAPGKFVLSPGDLERLSEARRLLEGSYFAPPSLKTLSRNCGLNESKVKKGFRVYYGETFSDILRKERMRQALALMKKSDKPVSLVANLVGYSNISHFIAAFRAEFGLTPGQMRRLDRHREKG
jgi:AraC-like DNA-binding protein